MTTPNDWSGFYLYPAKNTTGKMVLLKGMLKNKKMPKDF
jgi:hypothetical protein